MLHFTNSSIALEEVYSQSLCSRQISLNQLHHLQAISRASALNPQQNRLIKRLIHASRRGWIRVIE